MSPKAALDPKVVEKMKAAALKDLDADAKDTYANLVAGLSKSEKELPKTCTQDNRGKIGKVITAARKAAEMANETFQAIAGPWDVKVKQQRVLWREIADRAIALAKRAEALVQALIDEEDAKRKAAEDEARKAVEEAQARQRAAEAKAMTAETPAEQKQAKAEADAAWNDTRKAVGDLERQPASSKVNLGSATVYQADRLDYEVTDLGKFATAHPELVEVKRGATIKALRDACRGMATLPGTLPGFPGITLKMGKRTTTRTK